VGQSFKNSSPIV